MADENRSQGGEEDGLEVVDPRVGSVPESVEMLLAKCTVAVVLVSLLLAALVVSVCVLTPSRPDPRDRCGAETERAWQIQRMILSTVFGFLMGVGASRRGGREREK